MSEPRQRRLRISTSVAVLACLGLSLPAAAHEAPNSDKWSFLVAPYLWAVGIDGTAGVSVGPGIPVELPVDLDFQDLASNLDSAAMLFFGAQRGRWSTGLELMIANLKATQTTALPSPLMGSATYDLKFKFVQNEVWAAYRFGETFKAVELIGGLRYNDQEADLNVTLGPLQPNIKAGDEWVDPFIGVRYRGPIAPNWHWVLRGDIGGFGIGSKSTWRADIGASWHVAPRWEMVFKIKLLDVDYTNGNPGDPNYYRYDALQSGFLIGGGFRFGGRT